MADQDHEEQYRGFWANVGATFPDLAGARSTTQYRNDERWLVSTQLPTIAGPRILKTDLWDEAKNTHILRWTAAQGAEAVGVDISPAIVADAQRGFADDGQRLLGVQGDVRALPFRTGSVDAVYSMGTIEHFDDTEGAVREIFRVLRPGGRAIIGVPNRRDPFLRPLLVVALYYLGLYGYGFEKSYSRPALRRMLERAGFDVVAESGILFIPGWLRMLDLACHAWLRPLAWVTGALCAPFDRLSRRFPALRRHGYLIASVGVRPASDGDAG
ncbi:MAG: class I SAM-dependent methyltransferase [Acidobacteria bacterium]|nr:class I SAM-dependent methyltransferase [Acidobacteriota bacterium]